MTQWLWTFMRSSLGPLWRICLRKPCLVLNSAPARSILDELADMLGRAAAQRRQIVSALECGNDASLRVLRGDLRRSITFAWSYQGVHLR